MDKDVSSLTYVTEEYRTLIENTHANDQTEMDWQQVKKLLITEADWTPLAADHLAYLVQHYGAFILRNAWALAIAMKKEDGDFGL
ncbi:MAG: hypothetical protein JW828_01340 [Sedimentisphaerales bacterium]|nr:hypothetical protein [Sedimentisphaerales bacterium]